MTYLSGSEMFKIKTDACCKIEFVSNIKILVDAN